MGFNIQTHREVTQVETVQDPALGIMRWGRNNSFPQTLKNLIAQSASASPAVSRTAKFYRGGRFEGDDIIVNPYGQTLSSVISALADDYATYDAFAMQCNVNIHGDYISMIPIKIAELRFNEFDDFNMSSKIGYHPNFGLNSEIRTTVANYPTRDKIKWINRFNPEAILKQIEKEKGLSNYQGQILYFSESGHSSYPTPKLQPVINFVLSDIENSILIRKETSTGFIQSYLLKTMMDAEDPNLIALEDAIDEAQGARGSGKVVTMAGLSEAEFNGTVLEAIGTGDRDGVIEGAKKAYDLNKTAINSAYLIPPILAGSDQKTGFSQTDLKDAYFVFNSITQENRDTLSSEISRVLQKSKFAIKEIKIPKLKLDLDEEVEANPVNPKTDV